MIDEVEQQTADPIVAHVVVWRTDPSAILSLVRFGEYMTIGSV